MVTCSVYWEELDKWGKQIETPKLGAIALCEGPNGYGMAGYWSEGWLSFVESEVIWKPAGALAIALRNNIASGSCNLRVYRHNRAGLLSKILRLQDEYNGQRP